ncbi:hypothetical protein FRC19_005094 [Serendipita sp. 401]|nr:hypothetical protein FRC19_005094 [Serendipita sp. 401]
MNSLHTTPDTSGHMALDKQHEDRRCNLLAQIDSANSGIGSIDTVSTTNLKILYNQTIDEKWIRRRGLLPDPLVALPEDIWPSIIAQAVDYTNRDESRDSLLHLICVSRLWMIKLVSCPALWTTITINPWEEDLLAKVAVFLSLSKQSNLKIEFTSTGQGQFPNEVYDMLAPYTSRVEELSFSFLTAKPIEQMVRVVQSLGYLPGLKWIRNSPNEFTVDSLNRILQYVPNLRGVKSVYLHAEDLIDPRSVLANTPSFTLYSGQKLPDIRYNYEKLRELKLNGDYLYLLNILRRLNCPLVRLSMEMPSEGVRALIGSISRFSRLESLEICIWPRLQLQGAETLPDIPLPILPIRSLLLTDSISVNEAHYVPRKYPEFDVDVTSIVERSMPYIETLTLWGVQISSGLISLLQSLYRLQKLSIHAHMNLLSTTEYSPLHLPQLEYLIWDFNAANILRSRPLIACSVRTCILMPGYYDTPLEPRVTSAALLPQGCCNSLVMLSIETLQPFHFLFKDLSALRELEFGVDTHNCWVGDILEQLIIFPSTCPTLQKLTFQRFCREWDILFLALERRNFLRDCTVSLIREIEMPTTPPYSFLYPLTQLLGGKFPEYPSAKQYATLGFDDISDRQICYHCRLSSDGFQRWEEMSTNISEDWDWTYRSSTSGERSDPPLKASVEDWIAGKADRRLQIKESVERALKRGTEFGLCGNCITQSGPVVVTAYSLDGTGLGDIARPR